MAIEYVGKYLRRAVAYGQDLEARYYMAVSYTHLDVYKRQP